MLVVIVAPSGDFPFHTIASVCLSETKRNHEATINWVDSDKKWSRCIWRLWCQWFTMTSTSSLSPNKPKNKQNFSLFLNTTSSIHANGSTDIIIAFCYWVIASSTILTHLTHSAFCSYNWKARDWCSLPKSFYIVLAVIFGISNELKSTQFDCVIDNILALINSAVWYPVVY